MSNTVRDGSRFIKAYYIKGLLDESMYTQREKRLAKKTNRKLQRKKQKQFVAEMVAEYYSWDNPEAHFYEMLDECGYWDDDNDEWDEWDDWEEQDDDYDQFYDPYYDDYNYDSYCDDYDPYGYGW